MDRKLVEGWMLVDWQSFYTRRGRLQKFLGLLFPAQMFEVFALSDYCRVKFHFAPESGWQKEFPRVMVKDFKLYLEIE